MISATQIRAGHVLKINNQLFRVLKAQHITPGKGNAVVQTELRNLKSKTKDNMRFRSAETVEQVDVDTNNVNFLYQEGTLYHFIDPVSYEQIEIPEDLLEGLLPYLAPETNYILSSYEGAPIGLTLPAKMSFEIVECDPPAKGMAGATKTARLSNELTVKVPLFIKTGDLIVVDTESGSYLEKA